MVPAWWARLFMRFEKKSPSDNACAVFNPWFSPLMATPLSTGLKKVPSIIYVRFLSMVPASDGHTFCGLK